jgi:hypothetical protein
MGFGISEFVDTLFTLVSGEREREREREDCCCFHVRFLKLCVGWMGGMDEREMDSDKSDNGT